MKLKDWKINGRFSALSAFHEIQIFSGKECHCGFARHGRKPAGHRSGGRRAGSSSVHSGYNGPHGPRAGLGSRPAASRAAWKRPAHQRSEAPSAPPNSSSTVTALVKPGAQRCRQLARGCGAGSGESVAVWYELLSVAIASLLSPCPAAATYQCRQPP